MGIRYPNWTMTARAVPLRIGATASRRPIAILALLLAFGLSAAHAAPIHTAAREGDVGKVRELLDQGADINRNSRSGTPLHVAVLANRQEIVELLIADGADVNASSLIFGMPLHVAAVRGSAALTSLLIANGADIAVQDSLGLTPLHIAAERGHRDVAELLIDAGADVSAEANEEETPLHMAGINQETDVMALLVAKGASAPPVEPVSGLLAMVAIDEAEGAISICIECHDLQKGQRREFTVGPYLWDVVGRPKAGRDDYEYSLALMGLGGNWTFEDLNAWLANAKGFAPGNKMAYPAIMNLDERAKIIAGLRQLSDKPVPLPE
jgi:cytochrome c